MTLNIKINFTHEDANFFRLFIQKRRKKGEKFIFKATSHNFMTLYTFCMLCEKHWISLEWKILLEFSSTSFYFNIRRGKFSLFTFSLSNFGIYYCEVFYLWANDFVSAKVLGNLLKKLNELLKRIRKKFQSHFNQTFHPWKRLFQVNRGHCTNIAWIESVPYIHTPASRTHKFFCDWNVSALKNMDRMDDWYVDHNCHLLKHQFRSLYNFFCSRFILAALHVTIERHRTTA